MSLGLKLKLRRRGIGEAKASGPFAELDRKLAAYMKELEDTRAAVKAAGGAYVKMDQAGVWRCRMRVEKFKYERLHASTSAGLLELVKAWQVKHEKAAEAPAA